MNSQELPSFMSESVFDQLGYTHVILPDNHPYYTFYTFENKPGLEHSDYGKMTGGKIVIYVNPGAGYSYPFIKVRGDGGTRTVFNGVVQNTDQLKTILSLVR